MQLISFKNTIIIALLTCFSCGNTTESQSQITGDTTVAVALETPIITEGARKIIVGANRLQKYLPLLKGKSVGVVANQTSVIQSNTVYYKDGQEVFAFTEDHLVDNLLSNKINVTKVFAPEHGFRGTADAGELVKDGIDTKTGVAITSLYGKNKKPSPEQLHGLDMVVFDIQDVGARFYTYISSLHYVMEACAEAGIPVMVLDRPNPNGHYIDGPILEPEHKSFVGMHPIPVVHGMTMGEYAQMINGEKWLTSGIQCELTVITMENYTHDMPYSVPIKPSPNMPNDVAINLYPSLCFFEGTPISAGRGTDKQFQIFGAPSLPSEMYSYTFTPQSNEGAKHPKFKGEKCYGKDLSATKRLSEINLEWLIEGYTAYGKKPSYFIDFFTTLAGTRKLQAQIIQGLSPDEIRESWQDGLKQFNAMRSKYLLYK